MGRKLNKFTPSNVFEDLIINIPKLEKFVESKWRDRNLINEYFRSRMISTYNSIVVRSFDLASNLNMNVESYQFRYDRILEFIEFGEFGEDPREFEEENNALNYTNAKKREKEKSIIKDSSRNTNIQLRNYHVYPDLRGLRQFRY